MVGEGVVLVQVVFWGGGVIVFRLEIEVGETFGGSYELQKWFGGIWIREEKSEGVSVS